jgi:cellulose synthase/poly-beta-1,6-N-acetylglucosamine synthase-like glycosyltransferase
MPTLPDGTRVVVVADNCRDTTAEIARELGAEAVERQHATERGKGYALDFGLAHLAKQPPQAVVFIDADCEVNADMVRRLAAAAIEWQRPVQGLNLCDPDPRGGALQAVSGLAFRFKNLVRMLGLARLARLNYLTGTGMALPWELARRTSVAGANVVEDMQWGIDLALAGFSPRFLPEAVVRSPLPQQRAAARTQRTRWEHGHLKTLLTQTPRLAMLALKHRRFDLLLLGLDLAIPPLSLLVMTTGLLVALAIVFAAVGVASWWPASVLGIGAGLLASSVIAGWARHCRRQVPWQALVTAPFYAAWKAPIYLAFLGRRQREWVRTERDAPTTAAR